MRIRRSVALNLDSALASYPLTKRGGVVRDLTMAVESAATAIFPPMSAARQAFGELGERVAARWMERQGWRVVQRRFRNGRRDIDLVMERDGTVAFVEVKARRGSSFGTPVEAVNWRKQKELAKSAHVWIDRHGRPEEDYRFDVVGVLVEGTRVRVRHVTDAFPLHVSA